MPRILRESDLAWSLAVDAIRKGDLVVFPTDTVYGVGCDPHSLTALENIYIAKGRPPSKAIPLLLANISDLPQVCGKLSRTAELLGEKFWPGALTLVVERSADLPPQLGMGNTIAVRIPAHDALRSMIERCGGALAVTSANRSGEPDALIVSSAANYLGEAVAIYVDGGRSPVGKPSTLVDCAGEAPKILREGGIPADAIRIVLRQGGM